MSVPKLANARLLNKSRYFSGMAWDIARPRLCGIYRSLDSGRREISIWSDAVLSSRDGIRCRCRSGRGQRAESCGGEIQTRAVFRFARQWVDYARGAA